MADQIQIGAAIESAARVAREYFGANTTFTDTTVVATRARSIVIRCHLADQPGAPHSIIAKLQTSDDARGFSDWAGLAFLTSLDDARNVAPRFYCGDPTARLFVMEDLGQSNTISDLISADDAVALRRSLRLLAETMARLVASTADSTLEARYEFLRAQLPGGQEANRRAEAQRWRAARPRAAAWFDAFDCPRVNAVEQTMAHIAAVYAEPGPFLAFSHGDPAPSNNHICPDAAYLLDFEYGAYRHALYDLAGWYVLCPLPETWAAEMHARFRQHLHGAWSPHTDEANYHANWATICAYRALAIMSWLSPDILEADRPWAEGWTMRGALLTAATRLARATAGTAELAPLSEAGNRLAIAARARWPELGTGLPHWPGEAGS